MTVEVRVLDDQGNILAFHAGPAMQPLQFKTQPEHPLVEQILDDKGKLVAEYKWYGFIIQPLVKLISSETY